MGGWDSGGWRHAGLEGDGFSFGFPLVFDGQEIRDAMATELVCYGIGLGLLYIYMGERACLRDGPGIREDASSRDSSMTILLPLLLMLLLF